MDSQVLWLLFDLSKTYPLFYASFSVRVRFQLQKLDSWSISVLRRHPVDSDVTFRTPERPDLLIFYPRPDWCRRSFTSSAESSLFAPGPLSPGVWMNHLLQSLSLIGDLRSMSCVVSISVYDQFCHSYLNLVIVWELYSSQVILDLS